MSDPADFYTGLVARMYAPLRSSDPDPATYRSFVVRYGAPALELGCGDGDPLLDLVATGLHVEGLDSSADMIARARRRAAERGLEVTFHRARMEDMSLGRTFRSIYLAGPTFNLLVDDDRAAAALARVRAHLEPGGVALVPLFVPPDESHRVGEVTTAGSLRLTRVAARRDRAARTQVVRLRYEDGDEMVERDWVLHWHTPAGFRELAVRGGLEVVSVQTPSGAEMTPDATEFVFLLRRPG